MGVNRFTSAARNAGADVANGAVIGTNGGVNVADGRTFASPLYAGPGDVFGVEVIPAFGEVQGLSLVAASRIRLRLFFEGYRRRPVA